MISRKVQFHQIIIGEQFLGDYEPLPPDLSPFIHEIITQCLHHSRGVEMGGAKIPSYSSRRVSSPGGKTKIIINNLYWKLNKILMVQLLSCKCLQYVKSCIVPLSSHSPIVFSWHRMGYSNNSLVEVDPSTYPLLMDLWPSTSLSQYLNPTLYNYLNSWCHNPFVCITESAYQFTRQKILQLHSLLKLIYLPFSLKSPCLFFIYLLKLGIIHGMV